MHRLIERIREFGDLPALAMPDGVHTYAGLAALTDATLARMRAEGVAPGESVAIVGDHSPETVAALLACLEARLIAVPMTGLTESEASARRRVARVTRSTEDGFLSRPAPEGDPAPLLEKLKAAGRPGLVLFSSGTSGEPKALAHDLATLADSYRDRRGKAPAMTLFLLFDHIGGLNTLLGGLASGALLVVPRDRTPEAVAEAVSLRRASVLPTSPTFLNLLLISGCVSRFDLSSLRVITYGTEPMPESLLRRLREALPGARFIQTFGTSETGIMRSVSKSSDSTFLKFDDPDREWRVVDGELWLRSATRALGYLNHDSSRFTDDGWFRTGDRVESDGEGYMRIVGRLSEMINVGGEKVVPAEVESVVLEVPGVLDATVRGEPNPLTGNIVVAEVVPAEPGGSEELRRAVRSHCRERLSGYKTPAKVVFVAALPESSRLKKVRRG